jgi:hypothetical protein
MKTISFSLIAMLSLVLFSCQNQDALETLSSFSDEQLKSAEIAVNDIAVEGVTEELDFETNFYANYEHMLRQLAKFKVKKHNLMEGNGDMHYDNGKAPVVTIDTAATGYPVTITLAYGDSTLTRNGRVIKGTVIIVLSAERKTDGATRTITFNNCSIDSIAIAGTLVETFNGDNTTSRKITTSSDVTFTLADGTVIDRVGNHVREWLGGLDTPLNREDDKFQITGSTNINSSNGNAYVRQIVEPLIGLGDCRYFVQGIVEFSKNNEVIGELNYGDGECDNLANLTTEGSTIEIELKGRMPKAKTEGFQMGGKKMRKGR